MRTEKEMYGLIISIAQSDERIRAVYLNGSRTNPNVNLAKFYLCNFLTNTLIIQAIRIISTVG